jgi:glycosyltransferase involved in cell wall biosynthesis
VDTFPSSVLEALACGTPVIATSVGGIPEQVQDGQTGYLVPGGNAEQMAAKIVALLEKDDLRMRMQKNAVAHAQRQFGLEQQVNSYLDWYHEMTAEYK